MKNTNNGKKKRLRKIVSFENTKPAGFPAEAKPGEPWGLAPAEDGAFSFLKDTVFGAAQAGKSKQVTVAAWFK